MPKPVYHRSWLNRGQGMAAVEVEVTEWGANFTIADCGRKITLDFGNKKALNAHKIAQLRKAIDILETGLDQ